jgi:hypothetical protein
MTALACLVLLGESVAPAAAQTGGVVEGKLINATADAGVPAGATAVLYRVRERQVLGEDSQAVDTEGRFRFQGLDVDPSLVYLLVAEYHGVLYPHPQLLRPTEQSPVTLEATVYETTSDPSAVTLERASMLAVEVDSNHLVVMEMGTVLNDGDRTYVGDERGALRLSLPAGATDVQAEAGLSDQDLEVTPDGVVSRRPVSPGRLQFAVRYSLPVEGSVLDLSKRLGHPVSSFNLYVPQGVLQASSPQLIQQGGAATELGGVKYQVYNGNQLPADSTLTIRISGLPARGWQLGPEQLTAATLAGTLALGAAAWLLVLRRTADRRPLTAGGGAGGGTGRRGEERGGDAATSPLPLGEGQGEGVYTAGAVSQGKGVSDNAAGAQIEGLPRSVPSAVALQAERRRLVLELAELDERHAAGAVAEDDYQAQRGERKRRLLAVARQMEEGEA